jgi:glutamate synthase domain-containing protein 2
MEEWVNEVKLRAASGKPLVSGGRSNKLGKISFDDLVFIPKQLAGRPIDYFKEEIITETIIGKNSQKPLKLSMPILIPAMSFGALSKEAKIALAKASSLAGIATNTGEGGMLPEERANAKLLVAQYSTGRFGVNEEYIKSADAIEIKIGQGAKPGQGGLLPANKVTEEIARVRDVPMGKDIHSPPAHPDIFSIDDLKKKVKWLRELTEGKPIIIKLGAGDVENDVRLALKAEPDVIAIDGMEGGTGAAPRIMLDDFGIPTLAAVVKARKVMGNKSKQDLIVGGGLNKGADIAKALALGADAVFMSFPLLVSMGCIYCKQCYLGKCPVGITTQDPELRKKLNVDDAVKKVVNFLNACNEEVKMAAAACGKRNVHELDKDDLISLSLRISQITGIPLV